MFLFLLIGSQLYPTSQMCEADLELIWNVFACPEKHNFLPVSDLKNETPWNVSPYSAWKKEVQT